MLYLWPWFGPLVTIMQIRYVLPVLMLTSSFHIMGQIHRYSYELGVCDVTNYSP